MRWFRRKYPVIKLKGRSNIIYRTEENSTVVECELLYGEDLAISIYLDKNQKWDNGIEFSNDEMQTLKDDLLNDFKDYGYKVYFD